MPSSPTPGAAAMESIGPTEAKVTPIITGKRMPTPGKPTHCTSVAIPHGPPWVGHASLGPAPPARRGPGLVGPDVVLPHHPAPGLHLPVQEGRELLRRRGHDVDAERVGHPPAHLGRFQGG